MQYDCSFLKYLSCKARKIRHQMMFCKGVDSSHLKAASWASYSSANIRVHHSEYLATMCRTPSRRSKCCSTTSRRHVQSGSIHEKLVVLCENTDHLLNLRPPALSIEIQAPMGKGLEWGSKCPGDLAHSMANLLLL